MVENLQYNMPRERVVISKHLKVLCSATGMLGKLPKRLFLIEDYGP